MSGSTSNYIASTTSYATRQITFQFQLGEKGRSFSGSKSNTLTVTGLRALCSFQSAIGDTLPQGIMQIYGLSLDQMNTLTTAGKYLFGPNKPGVNTVTVSAGIANGPMSTIFQGTIVEAYPDGNQPNMAFFVRAVFGIQNLQYQITTPTTFKGSVPIGTVMQAIAQKANINFENHGVTSVLSNPYFAGSARVQMVQAANAANAYIYFDNIKNTVAIWPMPKGSRGSSGIIVSPATGMIGYPAFEAAMINVKTIYDPGLIFIPGETFEVRSTFGAANGKWIIINCDINISSQMPKGPWEIMVRGGNPDNVPNGPQPN